TGSTSTAICSWPTIRTKDSAWARIAAGSSPRSPAWASTGAVRPRRADSGPELGHGMRAGALGTTTGALPRRPLTATTAVLGVVRDALIAEEVRRRPAGEYFFGLPVVGETFDGLLNDVNGFHVTREHVFAAVESAAGGPVPEGNVGGGTGMICHGFKGGIGTASRRLDAQDGAWTVGVLVQANHGSRERLRVNGAPVGERIPAAEVSLPDAGASAQPGTGSI